MITKIKFDKNTDYIRIIIKDTFLNHFHKKIKLSLFTHIYPHSDKYTLIYTIISQFVDQGRYSVTDNAWKSEDWATHFLQ